MLMRHACYLIVQNILARQGRKAWPDAAIVQEAVRQLPWGTFFDQTRETTLANSPHFIFHALGGGDYSHCTDKAAVSRVNRNHPHEEPTVGPPIEEVRDAFAHIAPLWSKNAANERQSVPLVTLLVTLLPKLLSGKLTTQVSQSFGLTL